MLSNGSHDPTGIGGAQGDEGKNDVQKLIDIGGPLAGTTIAVTVGFATGGPFGAVAAAALGPLVASVAKECMGRALTRRQRQKVGAGFLHALDTIHRRLESGDRPREDGFFDLDETGRSSAQEIFEGVLLKCQNEHQEKKLKYIGNIIANAGFSPAVSPETVNRVLEIAGHLTYRQICFLGLIGGYAKRGMNTEFLRAGQITLAREEGKTFSAESELLILELRDLGTDSLGLINYAPETDANKLFGDASQNVEGPVTLSHLGQICFDLMGLQDSDWEYLHGLASLLRPEES